MATTALQPADDRAVSPVVGAIPMVAIVVVLAVVVGVMAPSFGDTLAQPAPVITVDAEYNGPARATAASRCQRHLRVGTGYRRQRPADKGRRRQLGGVGGGVDGT